MKVLTEHERGWLEAAIDGEGSIGVYKSGRSWIVRVGIASINRIFCEKAKEIFGGGSITVHKKQAESFGRQPIYQFVPSSNGLREVLPQLELVLKEEQRLIALQALNILAERRGKGMCSDTKNKVMLQRTETALKVLADATHRLNQGMR